MVPPIQHNNIHHCLQVGSSQAYLHKFAQTLYLLTNFKCLDVPKKSNFLYFFVIVKGAQWKFGVCFDVYTQILKAIQFLSAQGAKSRGRKHTKIKG